MQWKPLGKGLFAGTKTVEIRSICIPDEDGNLKRRRTTSCWNPANPKFSKTPAIGRLIKDESGKIGILVSGKHGTHIKIGKFASAIPFVFIAINCIAKKPRAMLLKDLPVELYSEGNLIFAREK
ncbi:MAG TPA: hypothetical protein PK165_03405 [bacterium]|nr:hypothetical protein [bacterium]HPO51863.1 hypothetical protein [bacterium]